jgi:AraC-like DNA-binding protein
VPYPNSLFHRIAIHFSLELFDGPVQLVFADLFKNGPRYYADLSSMDINFHIKALMDCKNLKEPLYYPALKSRMLSFFTELVCLQSMPFIEVSSSGDIRIQGVIKYLTEHLKEDISLEDLSRRFNISKNHLNVLFQQAAGTTVKQYIKIKRLGLAREEILRGTHAEEAAYLVGYNDYSSFFKAYKSHYGLSPSSLIVKNLSK